VNRLIGWLIVLVLMLFGLQWLVPQWVGGAAADWLATRLEAPKPTVEVSAVPFWQLASGRFQLLVIDAHDVKIKGVDIEGVKLSWVDGQVALDGHGQPVRVVKVGRLSGAVILSQQDLARLVDREGLLQDSVVHIERGTMRVAGQLSLVGHRMPLRVDGRLSIENGGEALWFTPQQLDGAAVPLTTTIHVLNLAQLKLPLAVRLTGMTAGRGQLRLTFASRRDQR
jgi:hypothetical protein